jgi:alpha-L-arabinofuranosidase
VPVPNLPRVYAVAGRDEDSGDVVLKLVNPTDDATAVAIELAGLTDVAREAKAIVLSGEPDDVNSIEQPNHVAPREATVNLSGSKFEHTLPPNSLTILRIGAP